MSELTEKINEIQNSWANFKQVNNERLQELEKKSKEDAKTSKKETPVADETAKEN